LDVFILLRRMSSCENVLATTSYGKGRCICGGGGGGEHGVFYPCWSSL
jgi:hypothetical protein